MARKPVIGISMRLELETDRFYLGRDYSEALESLGAIPLHFSLIPNPQYLSEIVRRTDGILLPGSDTDVDPWLFGEEPRPNLKKIVPEKEATDLLVLEEAERMKKNVLGICFGMQILNVYRGGTLYQDIESDIENCLKHEQGRPLARESHSIRLLENSLVSKIAGDGFDKLRVNSHHHQSVKAVGSHLRPTAWAKDGVVECIEDTREDRFVLGVQWHPELSWKWDRLSRGIFEHFIAACTADDNR
ncbi:MAG: gamma-glutamyl-gamma-aminobutyrate hydrolase family protein [Acidobacteria bacterium]|nr:gamma-glutamyl-gamma-aminobutyrate hydrolase family protein [Acidobacteriota bacterium]